MKIVEWIDRAVENGDYPVIEENSRTAESMQEISRSVFMANGFNSDAFIIDFPPVKDKFASAYFPEKVGLEISYYIGKAKKLELILPGEEEKEIILQQIRELKENIGILVSGSFPSLPNDVIERQVNLYFIALERGPDSVITSSAKQSLSEKQMQEIYSGWDEILSHQTVPSIPEGDDQSPALKTQINQAISSYTRPLIKVIHSKFNENLPDQFKFFEKPERLRMLTQSFIHDLHAN
ncbi:MAG: hypothetical protein JXR73_00005 [Candidatus Omnitrophica bacterium]|nr:hypothetical protein [Candidatus Omnitrophota bacterium]